MSFNVNIGSSAPVIKASAGANNDGGSGGNLGYMMQERKKQKDKKTPISFKMEDTSDTFEMTSKLEAEGQQQKSSWISGLVEKFMG